MIQTPSPQSSLISPKHRAQIPIRFPREYFWQAYCIYRQISRISIHKTNFIRTMSWIQMIHSHFFQSLAMSEYLPTYMVLHTELTHTRLKLLCPIHQIFSMLGIIPSHYLTLKRTLIEEGLWIQPKSNPNKTTEHQLCRKSLPHSTKAYCLRIHSHQYLGQLHHLDLHQ